MKKFLRITSCSLLLLLVLVFNPFWPSWGRPHDHPCYDGYYIRYTPTDLATFLRDECYSLFQHVSAILSLVFLCAGIVFVGVSIAVSCKKKKPCIVVSILAASLLLASSCLLPFSHDITSPILWFYFALPLVSGGMFIASEFLPAK